MIPRWYWSPCMETEHPTNTTNCCQRYFANRRVPKRNGTISVRRGGLPDQTVANRFLPKDKRFSKKIDCSLNALSLAGKYSYVLRDRSYRARQGFVRQQYGSFSVGAVNQGVKPRSPSTSVFARGGVRCDTYIFRKGNIRRRKATTEQARILQRGQLPEHQLPGKNVVVTGHILHIRHHLYSPNAIRSQWSYSVIFSNNRPMIKP